MTPVEPSPQASSEPPLNAPQAAMLLGVGRARRHASPGRPAKAALVELVARRHLAVVRVRRRWGPFSSRSSLLVVENPPTHRLGPGLAEAFEAVHAAAHPLPRGDVTGAPASWHQAVAPAGAERRGATAAEVATVMRGSHKDLGPWASWCVLPSLLQRGLVATDPAGHLYLTDAGQAERQRLAAVADLNHRAVRRLFRDDPVAASAQVAAVGAAALLAPGVAHELHQLSGARRELATRGDGASGVVVGDDRQPEREIDWGSGDVADTRWSDLQSSFDAVDSGVDGGGGGGSDGGGGGGGD